jgi:hypothetical protein
MKRDRGLEAIVKKLVGNSLYYEFPKFREHFTQEYAGGTSTKDIVKHTCLMEDSVGRELEVLQRVGAVTVTRTFPKYFQFSEVAEKHLADCIGAIEKVFGEASYRNLTIAMTHYLQKRKLAYQNGSLNVSIPRITLQTESDLAMGGQKTGISALKNTADQSDGREKAVERPTVAQETVSSRRLRLVGGKPKSQAEPKVVVHNDLEDYSWVQLAEAFGY